MDNKKWILGLGVNAGQSTQAAWVKQAYLGAFLLLVFLTTACQVDGILPGTQDGSEDQDAATDTDTDNDAGLDQDAGGPIDECNTTQECKTKYGSDAIDCVDSQTDQSWCECAGGVRCDSLDTPDAGIDVGDAGNDNDDAGNDATDSGAVPDSEGVISGELRMWHKITITWDGPDTDENAQPNPFLDYRLQCTFTGPSGQTFVVPGYYAADGNAANTSATVAINGDVISLRTRSALGPTAYRFRTGTMLQSATTPTLEQQRAL